MMNNTTLSGFNGSAACQYDTGEQITRFIKLALYIAAMIVSLTGNLLVICVVYRNRRLRTPTNYLITNMAVGDFLMTVIAMTPSAATFVTNDYSWFGGWLGLALCKLLSFGSGATMAASIFTLTAIAFERFNAIVFPLRSTMRAGNTKWVITVVWLVSFVVMLPLLFVMVLEKENGSYYCLENWAPPLDQTSSPAIFTLAVFIILYAVPLILITLLYACVVYTVWFRQIPGNTNRSMKKLQLKVRKNVVKMLITVVVVFAIFWLPMHVIQMMSYLSNASPCGPPMYVYVASFLLAHSTGAINFLIYVMFSEDYKQGFKGLFRCIFLFGRKASIRLGQPSVRTENTVDNRRSTAYKHDIELRRLTSASNNDQEEVNTLKGTKNVRFESEYSSSV